MDWSKEPDPEWDRLLALVAPPSQNLSHLRIFWEPGDSWEPIHRWFIWQMRPIGKTNPEMLHALKGPHPRSTGHFCAPGQCKCPKKLGIWRDSANPMLDRQTYEIFQKTGLYGTRWWVIQGHGGGHKYRMDPLESRISKMNGGPKDTPVPGALPYADFDMRTLWKIAALDRLRLYKGLIRYCDRKHEALDSEEAEAKVEAQAQVWNWLKSQTDQTYESISKKQWGEFRSAMKNAPGEKDTTDYEAVQENFVTQPNC